MREGMKERDRGSPEDSGPPPRRGPAYKTKLCKLWRGRGGCPRPSCGFAHGEAELRRPPPRPSFQSHPRPGRQDYGNHDFRVRPERRHFLRGRYSPERDDRVRPFRDHKPRSQDRGSSLSRSPIRKRSFSDRKESKSLDDGKTDSSESFGTSDNEERKKGRRYSISDKENDYEEQLKRIRLDMETLREDKSKLEVMLELKVEEVHRLSSRIDDLESLLEKETEDCRRMTSKTKKLIKAHGRYVKAQEDLKRSQARFERLADLLASDILKPCTKEQGSGGNTNEDPCIGYDMSPPSDQRQNHDSTAKKRAITRSTSEEAKSGKKRRESDDMIPMSEKYRLEDALEPYNNMKGNDTPRSLSAQKKLGEIDLNEEGNIDSSTNMFADRYEGEDEQVLVD